MIPEAADFREESELLYRLIEPLGEREFSQKTQFKGWTVNDIIAHLHFGNFAAGLSLEGGQVFTDFFKQRSIAGSRVASHMEITYAWLEGLSNRALRDRWRLFAGELADRFSVAEPKQRVQWFGPSMSARSSITARLMETWAHGQAIYDLLGEQRAATDRLRNVVVLGLNTFGWTFSNRGLPVPEMRPYVRLTSPSGSVWEWGDPSTDSSIAGSALEFCQVVTQVRNVADTGLKTVGETAAHWMEIAQCFAGPPENPPAPGTRFTQTK